MKIGILTLLRSINDGAVLQALSVQRVLQAYLPQAQIEIIDYQTDLIERTDRRRLRRRRPPFVNRAALQKRRSVQAFVRQEMTVSAESIITDDLAAAQRFVARQGYDAIVVGSDVVWQTRRDTLMPLPPNIFFLPGIQAKKVSFSASADRGAREQWATGDTRDSLITLIDDFSIITVRDQTTHDYLHHLGVANGDINFLPDPTLLYDISKVANVPSGFKATNSKLAGVAVSGVQLRQELTDQFMAQGYQVVNLLGHALPNQRRPPSASLPERLGVYPLLDMMVTDRFHGSIFTLKLSGCPTVFVEPITKYPAADSKGRDLFGRLGISDFVWRYEHKPITSDTVRSYEAMWRAQSPNIAQRLAQLAASAQPVLSQLVKQLS